MKKFTSVIALFAPAVLVLSGCTSAVSAPISSMNTAPAVHVTASPTPTPTRTITPTPEPVQITIAPEPTIPVETPIEVPPVTEEPPAQIIDFPNPMSAIPEGIAGEDEKLIALTFDDGPGKYTPQILEILVEKNVPATFFVVGTEVNKHPEILEELSEAGMSIQSHTYAHGKMTNLSDDDINADLEKSISGIKEATGFMPTCIRPPYGYRNQRTDDVSKSAGLSSVIWNIDPEDWKKPGTQKIADNAIQHAMPNGIILLHDGGGDRTQTVGALPIIIDNLKERGYTFITLCS